LVFLPKQKELLNKFARSSSLTRINLLELKNKK
jgi:hypothetical protein